MPSVPTCAEAPERPGHVPREGAVLRWLIIILCVGAILRFVPVWFGLPYRSRPDEEVAVSVALRILDGDLNPRFFHWPSLTFYVFAAAFGLWRMIADALSLEPAVDPSPYFIAGRIVVATAGTATLFVLFRLARRTAGDAAGLVAAALLAVAILHVRDSHFAMTDVLMTLLVTTSLALLLRAIDEPDARSALAWFGAAGLAGGLATSTKYNAGAVLAAMGAAQLVLFSGAWRTTVEIHRWLPSVAYGLLFGAGFLLASPYSLLDARTFWTDVVFDITHLSGGHGIDLGRGWGRHLTHSLPFGLGPTTFFVALWGVVPLARRHSRAAVVLGSFVALLYLSIGSGNTVFFRYILPVMPPLCVAAAVGILHAANWLGRRTPLSPVAALSLLLAATVGPGLVNSIWLDALLARTDTRILAGRWLEQRLQPGQSVYDSGGAYASLDLSRAPHHLWYFDRNSETFGHPEGRNPDWLVLHESPVSLYAGTPPQVHALAMREYQSVHVVHAVRDGAGWAVYDLQDAFFMPLWGLWTVKRPGPTIRIYWRVTLRRADSDDLATLPVDSANDGGTRHA